jgi:hypothetical protein
MSTVSVYVCPGANQTVDPLTGAPECTGGAGSWQQVTLVDPFDPATLNTSDLAGAYGAGFVVMGSGMAVVLGAAFVLNAIRGND